MSWRQFNWYKPINSQYGAESFISCQSKWLNSDMGDTSNAIAGMYKLWSDCYYWEVVYGYLRDYIESSFGRSENRAIPSNFDKREYYATLTIDQKNVLVSDYNYAQIDKRHNCPGNWIISWHHSIIERKKLDSRQQKLHTLKQPYLRIITIPALS